MESGVNKAFLEGIYCIAWRLLKAGWDFPWPPYLGFLNSIEWHARLSNFWNVSAICTHVNNFFPCLIWKVCCLLDDKDVLLGAWFAFNYIGVVGGSHGLPPLGLLNVTPQSPSKHGGPFVRTAKSWRLEFSFNLLRIHMVYGLNTSCHVASRFPAYPPVTARRSAYSPKAILLRMDEHAGERLYSLRKRKECSCASAALCQPVGGNPRS